jgi:hypothetical protein
MREKITLHIFKKNLFIIIFGIIIGFVLCETFTRIVIKDKMGVLPEGFMIKDELLEKKMSANFKEYYRKREFKNYIRTNSLGLRGKDIPSKKDNEIRILILGDSFTFGIGVEEDETYSSKLEVLLNSKIDKAFKVINAGFPGLGTYTQLHFFKEYGLKLNPDLVILQFYIDVFENMRYKKWKEELNLSLDKIERSKNYNAIVEKSNLFRNFLKKSIFLRKLHDRCVLLTLNFKKDYSDVTWGWTPNNEVAFLKKDTQLTKWGWQITKEALSEINNTAKQNNISLIILVTPAWCQLTNKVPGNNYNKYDLAKPNRILEEFATNNNIMLFDPLPLFQKFVNPQKYYYFYDQHWTKDGHEFIAKKLSNLMLTILEKKNLQKKVSVPFSKVSVPFSELCYEAFFLGGGLDIVPGVPQADITSPGDIVKSELVERVEKT